MASYIENALASGETILHVGKVSLWSQTRSLALGIALIAFGVFLAQKTQIGHHLPLAVATLGLLFCVAAWLRSQATELALTNRRVIAKFGLISRRTLEINLARIESLQVEQGILGRILNFGCLKIAGVGDSQEPVNFISDPLSFRRKFVEAQEALKVQ
ncbi:PH domain-containing protein [Niveibacterium terrae]|uniref:PH domain-containing protein n=1 Tax=Niveibacterium terrae TaxID=3373598 RepID=UPI003A8EE7FF